jgi:hypothetical protein
MGRFFTSIAHGTFVVNEGKRAILQGFWGVSLLRGQMALFAETA